MSRLDLEVRPMQEEVEPEGGELARAVGARFDPIRRRILSELELTVTVRHRLLTDR